MSKGYDRIQAALAAAGENPENEMKLNREIMDIYHEEGEPEDCKEEYGKSAAYVGMSCFYGWDVDQNYDLAAYALNQAYAAGNRTVREELGLCIYNGWGIDKSEDVAVMIWKEGLDHGDKYCALHYYVWQVENDKVDRNTIPGLEALANDPVEPIANACAVLNQYYTWEGDEDKAWEWREKGLEMGSELMQQLVDEEKEQEVGEDDWTRPEAEEEAEDEFDGYDDETEASHPGYPDVGEKYVIIAAVDDSFRIVQADAADWRSLPALIGAERCDDMRCEKFRNVSRALKLPGTLLGQLDKDAFRKDYLKPNRHASQWYDGMADLYGAMVICLEDNKYNPFSFSSKEEAQKVIDALRK